MILHVSLVTYAAGEDIKVNRKQMANYPIDYYAYMSKIGKWNPVFKVSVSMGTILICILADVHWVSLIVFFTMSALTVWKGGINLSVYVRLLLVPLAFVAMGTIAIAVGFSLEPAAGSSNYHVWFFYLYLSPKSFRTSCLVLLKTISCISAMYMMVLSTPVSEVIGVLNKLHLPGFLIELMNMVYRFIFILIDVQQRMKCSAVSRLGFCDFKTSCASFGSIAGNLFIISLKRANACYDAMLSRCYDGNFCFLEEHKPVLPVHMMGLIAYWLVLLAVALF